MFSHILTVKKNNGKSVQWTEIGFELSVNSFPILKIAKPGDRFKLTYNANDGWAGRFVKLVEKVD